jgi:hypothetical protein
MAKHEHVSAKELRPIADALVIQMGRPRIFCSKCWIEGRYARIVKMEDQAARVSAASQFFKLGWRFRGAMLCPRCVREVADE